MVRKKDDWIASLNDCPDSRANDHKDRVSSLMDGAITIPMIKTEQTVIALKTAPAIPPKRARRRIKPFPPSCEDDLDDWVKSSSIVLERLRPRRAIGTGRLSPPVGATEGGPPV